MNRIGLKVLLVVILAGLAVFLLPGACAESRAAGKGESAGLGQAPGSSWSAQEPVETPTPLPTLVIEEEPLRPGALAAIGLLVLCTMLGLMVVGVFAAILMVKLRQRM